MAASTAIPGIFPPVDWPPYRLADAGLVVPIPIESARGDKNGPVVAVDISTSYVPSQEGESVVTLLLRMQQSQLHANRATLLRDADLVLHPAIDEVKLPLTPEIVHASIVAGNEAVTNARPDPESLWEIPQAVRNPTAAVGNPTACGKSHSL